MLHHDLIPHLQPAQMLAWMAQNPLLLAAYPERCAAVAADFLAGKLTPAQVQVTADKMKQKRIALRLKLDYGHEGKMNEQAEYVRIQELLQASQLDASERSKVQAFAMRCHASEWPWLIARMEEVITRRANQETAEPAELSAAA